MLQIRKTSQVILVSLESHWTGSLSFTQRSISETESFLQEFIPHITLHYILGKREK